jgi:hypothetical protein
MNYLPGLNNQTKTGKAEGPGRLLLAGEANVWLQGSPSQNWLLASRNPYWGSSIQGLFGP